MTRRGVIDELEEAMATHPIAYRADALRRVTDLFLSGPVGYADDEVALFDDVMVRLSEQLETSVKAALAQRLATIPNAPLTLIRKLAADPAIEVAGPILRASPRLDDSCLVENAGTGSRDHLLAIAQRASVSEAVTDVLIARGDRTVALAAVVNAGARFSEAGQDILVERSRDDGDLALGVWSRIDVSHHRLLTLFAAATESVRKSLEAADRQKTDLIRDMVAEVSTRMQSRLRANARDYQSARKLVEDLRRRGGLDEAALEKFAAERRFDETAVTLSVLCDLPIGAVERALVSVRPELILLIARALRLSWSTTRAILLLRAGEAGMGEQQRDECLRPFSKLRHETAVKALQFLRLRERSLAAASEGAADGRLPSVEPFYAGRAYGDGPSQ